MQEHGGNPRESTDSTDTYTMMPSDLRIWVSERKPNTGAEAGQLADDYFQARCQMTRIRSGTEGLKEETRKCHQCDQSGHLACNCPQKGKKGVNTTTTTATRSSRPQDRPPVKCYNCRKRGHMSMNCPEKIGYCGIHGSGKSVAWRGLVEGVEVEYILLDTGCTQTMVRRDLTSPSQLIPGEATTIKCVHGDNVVYSLAHVSVDIEGLALKVRAAVSDSLPLPVLLATDVPELGQLLQGNHVLRHTVGINTALVTTRAQVRQEEVEQKRRERTEQAVKSTQLGENGDKGKEEKRNVEAGDKGRIASGRREVYGGKGGVENG